MAQPKGHTGNPNGRPKGTPNKVTQSVKEWINNILDSNRAQLEEDLKALEPAERWRIIEKLMSYVIPKQQAVNATIDIEKLSDDQLNTIVNEITKKI